MRSAEAEDIPLLVALMTEFYSESATLWILLERRPPSPLCWPKIGSGMSG